MDVFLFGQEADVLGRPLHYLRGSDRLTSTIQENIRHNAEIFSSDTNDYGICRPGKLLSSEFLEQHRQRDRLGRTDFINQIGPCPSSATGVQRILSCPTIETREEQKTPRGDLILGTNSSLARKQNMCGGASLKLDDNGLTASSFEFLELEPLKNLPGILEPGLAADACYRRAGSLCHTDLDCAPNRLHEEQVFLLDLDRKSFGNTDAELEFWRESLVCGQATPPPSPFLKGENDFEYDMSKNRCCRPVGE